MDVTVKELQSNVASLKKEVEDIKQDNLEMKAQMQKLMYMYKPCGPPGYFPDPAQPFPYYQMTPFQHTSLPPAQSTSLPMRTSGHIPSASQVYVSPPPMRPTSDASLIEISPPSITPPPSTIRVHSQSSNLDEPAPVPFSSKSESLPSDEINKEELLNPDVVVLKYAMYKSESKIGTLAVKLARESFFGQAVLGKCTVAGCRDLPGLPTGEVQKLKKYLFNLFPKYKSNPVGFELLWSNCVASINQCAKTIRKAKIL